MATTVSSTLLTAHKESQKSLNNIESTLNKLYAVQVKSGKELRTRTAKERQASKRRSGDKSLSNLLGIKKEDVKKEKKSIFDSIKNALGGIFGSLFKNLDIGKLLLGAGVGAAVVAYFKSPTFRKFVNDHILGPMGNAIREGLVGENGLFGKENRRKTWEWMKKNPLKTLGLAATAMAAVIGPKSTLLLGFKTLTTTVGLLGKAIGVKGSSGGLLAALGKLALSMKGAAGAATATKTALMGIGASFAAKIAALVGAPIAIAAGAGIISNKVQYNRAGGAAGGGDMYEQLMKETSDYKNQLRRPGDGRAAAENLKRSLKEDESHADYRAKRALADEIIQATAELDKARKAATKVETSGSGSRKRTVRTDDEAIAKAEANYRTKLADIQRRSAEIGVLTRQTGGPIRVPGSGSGDKVPMMLPEGSFVLNRNAAGYQNGGIPTLLEPGESVYGPGQWGPREMMLNSAIPRFQSGGVVETSHPDTGAGFQPGGATDYNGRPVVFSKEGAEAFAKAMSQSGGAVKGSDVASSKRSQAKNASLSGAHPNSSHLYGEGLDASGSTAAWLQSNPQLGWRYGYSHGPGSVHFNWKGGGAGLAPDGSRDSYNTSGNVVQNIMSSASSALSSLGGSIGKFMSGIIQGAKELFGPAANMLFGDLFGSSDVSPGSGGASSVSSGETRQVEEEVGRNLMKDMGVTKAQAAGIVGNLSYESAGMKPDIREGMTYGTPWPKGTIGRGYGWAQWTNAAPGDRLDKFIDHIGGANKVASNDQNYQYLLKEFRGPEPLTGMPSNDVVAASDWFRKEWERAGVPADAKRREIAQDVYQRLQTGGISSIRSSGNSRALQEKSENQFIEKLAAAVTPVVVPMPSSKSTPSMAPNPGTQTAPPNLSAYPNNNTALDLSYRLSMGAAFA